MFKKNTTTFINLDYSKLKFFHLGTKTNKEERYSRVPRLSDTRYSKGNGDMQAAERD